VPDDQDRTVADQLPCGGDRLLGIAEVVRRDQLYLLAKHATGCIDVGHGRRRATFHLLAELGFLPRDRAGHADQDVRPRGPAEAGCKQDNRHCDQAAHHYFSHFR
jgi:hypothetical protein